MSTTSYLVCPITGLSISYVDDYSKLCRSLLPATHGVVTKPGYLYLLCEKQARTIPKSYLIAGTLLHLHDAKLFIGLESPYLRGGINEKLQTLDLYALIELYWDAKNLQVRSAVEPIKLNLETLASLEANELLAKLKIIATQSLSGGDKEIFLRTKCIRTHNETAQKESCMSLKACCKRLARKLPKLIELDSEIPLASAKKAASLIRWGSSVIVGVETKRIEKPCWEGTGTSVLNRVIKILSTLAEEGIEAGSLERDDIIMRSINQIVAAIELEIKASSSQLNVGF